MMRPRTPLSAIEKRKCNSLTSDSQWSWHLASEGGFRGNKWTAEGGSCDYTMAKLHDSLETQWWTWCRQGATKGWCIADMNCEPQISHRFQWVATSGVETTPENNDEPNTMQLLVETRNSCSMHTWGGTPEHPGKNAILVQQRSNNSGVQYPPSGTQMKTPLGKLCVLATNINQFGLTSGYQSRDCEFTMKCEDGSKTFLRLLLECETRACIGSAVF